MPGQFPSCFDNKNDLLRKITHNLAEIVNNGGGGGGSVISVNGKTGVVVLISSDLGLGNVDNTSDANKPVSILQQLALDLKANLASPAFSGIPTAPTAAPGTNTTQLATTAFVLANATGGSPVWGAITGTLSDQLDLQAALDLKAPLASPALTGSPTAPTATLGNSSTLIATTAFVAAAITAYSPPATAWGTITGTLSAQADLAAALALLATLASPALTGTPTAPTATLGTNTTQLATTAFVTAAIAAYTPGAAAWGTITGTLSAQTDLVAALALKANLASPALTGTPTAPTATLGTSTTQLATTAFVAAAITAYSPPATAWGTITGTLSAQTDLNTALGLKAALASPTFTGVPAAPTATLGTSTTQLATTAFVAAAITAYSPPATAWGTITGTLSAQTDLNTALGLKAPLASPSLTGTPLSTTAAVDTNTTQIATTAFVIAQAASATPLINGTGAVGTSTRFARGDHVHPTDTTRAALASPTFTGTPAAPTATLGTNTTQIATTAFVAAAITAYVPSIAWGTITGTLSAQTDLNTALGLKAPLASPALTGTPTAPTAGLGTNTTQIATTAFVLANATGGSAVWGSITGTLSSQTDLNTALGLKANLASPTFTGTPAAPTAVVGTNTTQVATTAFVAAAVSAIPGASTDGWTAFSGTWTYASATTFTISGDYTTYLAKGDRIKLTQTTVKYFYVLSATFAAGTTTVTITGGSDYSLANAAITLPYTSKAVQPDAFPQWFNWSPTLVGFSVAPTSSEYRFQVVGRSCLVSVRQLANGTSNGSTFTVSLPIAATTVNPNGFWFSFASIVNSGTGAFGDAEISIPISSTVINFYRDFAGTAWASSGGKRGYCEIWYEI